jgi:hypothetical protein
MHVRTFRTYKARLLINGRCRCVRLYGPRRKHVDVVISWQAEVHEFTGDEIRTSDLEVQAKLDEALRMYDGPKGIWEEERRLR